MKSIAHALAFSGDTRATDGPSAADTIFILMATPSLPAAIGSTKTPTAGLRCLISRVER